MDVVESPLNLAHSQCRKAEKYVQSGKYDEAVECHQRAIDYLQGAISKTKVNEALLSLKLQQKRHLRDINIVKVKQQLTRTHQITGEKEQSALKKLDKYDRVGLLDHATACPLAKLSESGEGDDEALVYHTMVECDSLLTFLRSRVSASDKLYKRADQTEHDAFKVPKTEKVIIEELRLHNEALRVHVHDLLKENQEFVCEIDYLKKDNDELQKKLIQRSFSSQTQSSSNLLESTESDKSEKYYPNPNRIDINELPSLELPPLEMPKFDFNLLQSAAEDSSQ